MINNNFFDINTVYSGLVTMREYYVTAKKSNQPPVQNPKGLTGNTVFFFRYCSSVIR
jgi:hypothetical protein